MPLGLATRELELIIIATDHASATLARVGGGLTLLGAGMTRLAWEGVQAFGAMTEEALDFDRQARLAFTQVDDRAQTTLEDVKDVLRNVASEVGRPMEELQEGIFDIFSSIDANAETAEFALRKIAEAAVAGQTDVRGALIPTIATLNAFNQPLEEIDSVLDLQFKTVQKGIITYDELAAGIGKVIPAAVAAGQSQEQMGAIIAFLTRNGLSAQMAMTSAARAMELFSDPKAQKGLQDIGIAIKDDTGEFRQMNEVLTDMDRVFGELTGPERKEKFKEVFGTGRIQARRFFDIAIPQFGELNDLVNEFSTSGGAMQDAYDIMLEAPQSQLDILTNKWMLLREEIGSRFLPLIEERVIPTLNDLFDRWDNLTDEQVDQIVQWGSIATAVTGVVGVLTTAAGVISLMGLVWQGFASVAAAVGGALAAVLVPVAILAGAGFLIWQNWDRVVVVLEGVRDKLMEAWAFMKPFADATLIFVQSKWDEFLERVNTAWEKMGPFIAEAAEFFRGRWETVVDWWTNTAWPEIVRIVPRAFTTIREGVSAGLDVLGALFEKAVEVATFLWENFGDTFRTIFTTIFDIVTTVLGNIIQKLHGLMTVAIGIFTGDWETIKEGLLMIWDATWDTVVTILSGVWDILESLFKDLGAIISPIWEGIWQGIKDFFAGIWDGIFEFFRGILTSIRDFFIGIWEGIYSFFENLWNSRFMVFVRNVYAIFFHIARIYLILVWEFWKFIWNSIWSFFTGIWNGLTAFATAVWNELSAVWSAVWEGAKTKFETIWNVIKTTASVMWGAIKVIAGVIWWLIGDSVLVVWETVKTGLQGVWDFITTAANIAWTAIQVMAETIWGKVTDAFMIASAVGAGLEELFATVREKFGPIVSWIEEKVQTARDWLEKLDPRTWMSPPVTKTVRDGMLELSGVVTGELDSLNSKLPDHLTGIRGELGNVIPDMSPQLNRLIESKNAFLGILNEIRMGSVNDPLSQFGFAPGTSANQILQAKALQEQRTGATDPTASGGTTVTIGEVHSNADPTEIANEIAWKIVTGGAE